MPAVPAVRVSICNQAPLRTRGLYVLYWMIAARRTRWNFGLERAIAAAAEQDKPLLVLEALRCDYRWASDRHHRFVLDGMRDNAIAFESAGVIYHPYVEPRRGAGKGLLRALARRACLVVTDDAPVFFLPQMVAAAARQLPVRLERVDSNGLLPLHLPDRGFTTTHSFRRFLQKTLGPHLRQCPMPEPLRSARALPSLRGVPANVAHRWPRASAELLGGSTAALATLPIDHSVPPIGSRGGERAARRVLRGFIRERLPNYLANRNDPDADGTSELSPYLHFGQISPHEIFAEIARRAGWTPFDLSTGTTGHRSGWWGMDADSEAFIDQLVTWRELGYQHAVACDGPDERLEGLPEWARKTLIRHARDPRRHRYSLASFERAATHDPIWNAAQRQLLREGRIHNYLRMLWGKKILEWSRSPVEALRVMLELNNKYGVDGRDPNSNSGIFWVLGRYDRAWGPERPIFGTVRYMSSESARRKLHLERYLRSFGP